MASFRAERRDLTLSLSLFSSPHQPTAAQVCSTLSLSLSRGATNKQAVQHQRKSDQNLVQECTQHVELPSAFSTVQKRDK